MSMAFDNQAKDPRPRTVRDEALSAKDLLEQAQALAAEVEELLTKVGKVADTDAFRVRLARAHTLSLLDQLSELLGDRPSGNGPAVRSCAAPMSDDEDAASGVRRAPSWR